MILSEEFLSSSFKRDIKQIMLRRNVAVSFEISLLSVLFPINENHRKLDGLIYFRKKWIFTFYVDRNENILTQC